MPATLLRFLCLGLILISFVGCQGRSSQHDIDWRPLQIEPDGADLKLPCQITNNTDHDIRVSGFGRVMYKKRGPDIRVTWNDGEDMIGLIQGSGGKSTSSRAINLQPGQHYVHTYTFKDYAAYSRYRLPVTVFMDGRTEPIEIPDIKVVISLK